MREDDTKTKEGAALWRCARGGWTPPADDEAPDALWFAAYLDGSLGEDEAARLEARLAADPALLDDLLALREGLEAAPQPVTVPAAVVARAQALRPEVRRTPVVAERPSWVKRLMGGWVHQAVPAAAGLALLVACAGAFELGLYQAQQVNATQSAATSDSDVPVDLLMGGLI